MMDDYKFGPYDSYETFDDFMYMDDKEDEINFKTGHAVDDIFSPEDMKGSSGGYMYFLPNKGFIIFWLQPSIAETELTIMKYCRLETAYIAEGPYWLGFIRYERTLGIMELVYDTSYFYKFSDCNAKQYLTDIIDERVTVVTIDTDKMIYSNVFKGELPKKFHNSLIMSAGDQLCTVDYKIKFDRWQSRYQNKSLYDLWDFAKKTGFIKSTGYIY